jgi:hypothetical protein
LWLALGALSAFAVHEVGHLIADGFIGKDFHFVETKLGPFPFFAVEPCCNLTKGEQAFVASAGFFTQNVATELILFGAPRLRSKHHPFLKGMLFFNIGLSLGYGLTGLAGIGPDQSDVNTMSRGIDRPAWFVGTLLVVPAVIDIYRYLVPDSKWAPWVSLQAKLALVGATFTF